MSSDWYDYPQYFDLAFRDETLPEADFIEAACRKYCGFPAKRLLEPACGSGRLIVELASRGYQLTGFDLSQPMLDYARRRLARRRLQADLFTADMADFSLARPVDAAFNTFNSFRHLLTEESAVAHLRCVANALNIGGIYILGLHLLPPDAAEESTERWTASQGRTRLSGTLRVVQSSRRKRLETLRMSLLVRTPKRVVRIRSEFVLRLYNAAQLKSLLAKVGELELLEVFDFWYELDNPLEFNDEISDTVLILRKRGTRSAERGTKD
jgi:SAM-dependent methyltransferase